MRPGLGDRLGRADDACADRHAATLGKAKAGGRSVTRLDLAVPELTRSASIKLNRRVSLRRHEEALSLRHRAISPKRPGPPKAKPSGDHIPLGGFVFP